jgi:phage shock protein PspC (stress-responsive transcriptional regulator)
MQIAGEKMGKRLFRSRTDYLLGGVCGGLGQYVGIDSNLVRLFFILLFLASGSGVLVYLLLWVILPREGTGSETYANFQPSDMGNRAQQIRDEVTDLVHQPNPKAIRWLGIGLVIAGLFTLLQNLHLPWLSFLNEDILWPAVLILAGAILLVRALRGE